MNRESPPAASRKVLPIIIDTDPGIDDALAIILAARWTRCHLKSITVTYGNTTLDIATRNARLLMARGGCDAPVRPGWDRPLVRPLVTAKETHGESGLGDVALPRAEQVEPGTSALRDALAEVDQPVTLVTLGPLTNLALALRQNGDLVRTRVARHVAMGGCIEARGNTGPHSEFNIWCDPEAAAEVFRAGLGTELVGLDVTRKLVISAAAVQKLLMHPDEEAQWFGRMLSFYVRFHARHEGLQGAVINDPLAVALAVEPTWGEMQSLPLRVDLSDGRMRGRTEVSSGSASHSRVQVYRQFDHHRVHKLLIEHLFGRWLTPADFKK
jgi:inosine-uridine nucleoside N-ribohydrolase